MTTSPGSSIIDCHFHIFRGKTDRNETYIAEAIRAGITCGCTFLSGGSSTGALADDPNRDVIEFRQRHPDFVLPFARLHPDDGDRSVHELERLVVREGFVGLKLSFNAKANDRAYRPILEKAAELRIPVLVHTFMGRQFRPERFERNPDETDVLELVAAARSIPELMIIMSHYNLGDWEFGLKAVRDTPSIYPSTSGSGLDSGSIEMGVRECGAERIIFGTDSSLWTGLGKVYGADIGERERRLILGDNMRRILNQRQGAA